MNTIELEKTYDAKAVEERNYRYWMDNHHFRVQPDTQKKPYTIVIPPPNITGSLHMGHALDNTIQDVLIRYHRMLGMAACWVPGTDHAGIATQNVVEKQLKKEGKTRHDVGREDFIKRVWTWKEQYGNTIVEQLKRLGVSCDWDRLAFTMDAARSKAVREVFVRLFEKGDIYRGKRLINWCPHCLTALSDLEVEHEESQGALYYLRYPLVGQPGEVVIATTRPETILADVAVAVNPEDERFKHLIGKECTIPVAGRPIPIIADEAVLTDFGTGALKITPAHDPTDFEIGLRHGLPQWVCLDEEGRLNELGGKYQGQDRFKVRQAISLELEETGYLVKKEEHLNKVGHCYRCNCVIEPYLSDQWFMNMKRLAEPAVKAIHDGSIRFVPERYSKTYLAWMENIRDWCISRQIWWGHRIPVWTCEQCSHRAGHTQDPDKCPACGSAQYVQDPDVLDTWFSSGLWPFSVFGWPDKNSDLDYFYPTQTLVTGRDIINLWVARMIMLGYEFLGEKPYTDVHIHSTIMTRDGQRMSKSKGTGIDPLELIEKYGADGTRFGLMSQATQSQDVRHTEERYEQGRNFCNKIWNAVRLSLMLIPDGTMPNPAPQPTSLADRWLLTRTSQLTRKVRQAIENYNFDEAARSLYEFFWNELCDWYLELIKPVFYHRQDPQEQKQVAECLLFALDHYLRLSHPIMPMLTEELWHHLPGERGPLIHALMPQPGWEDAQAVESMEMLQELVRAARNLRAELGLLPKQKAEICLVVPADRRALVEDNRGLLEALALAEPVTLVDDRPAKALSQRVGELEVFLPFPADFDLSREVARLNSELAEARKLAEGTERKLDNAAFIEKAKPEVVAKERERLADYQERAQRVEERLKLFGGGAS
ncbi:valine--tRNA ligase [bacterium]|nr:valine--tRNA ligase [bacterium]